LRHRVTYTVANDLYASQGLTSKNGCIDIKSFGVSLFLDSYNIFGSGCESVSRPRSGVGIHVLPGASGILVEGEVKGASEGPAANLCGCNYGAESDGYNVYWRQIGFYQNGIGLFLNNTEFNNTSEIAASNNITGVRVLWGLENFVARADAENNAHYGFWIDGTKTNTFSQDNIYNDNNALSNGIAGFYVGCSATGDIQSTAPCVNTDNTLERNYVRYNRFYGIAVERGGVGNLIEDNAVLDQPTEIIDGSGTCKDNRYRHNGAPGVH